MTRIAFKKVDEHGDDVILRNAYVDDIPGVVVEWGPETTASRLIRSFEGWFERLYGTLTTLGRLYPSATTQVKADSWDVEQLIRRHLNGYERVTVGIHRWHWEVVLTGTQSLGGACDTLEKAQHACTEAWKKLNAKKE